jgi:hypothetical protein
MRELLHSFPGAAGYLPAAQQFGVPVSQQLVPEWQVADATRRAQRREVRREQMRFHTQRQEAVAAARQRASERQHDGKMASLIAQQQRHAHAVALEKANGLRAQATFRSSRPADAFQMPTSVAPPQPRPAVAARPPPPMAPQHQQPAAAPA